MDLVLNDNEVELLARLLANDLANLKEETGKTESYDWRMSLKEDERLIRNILDRIKAPADTKS